MAKASVILRFSNRSVNRLQNLQSLIRHISRCVDVEIILSVMENNLKLDPYMQKLIHGVPRRAKLIHNFTSAPFSSSAANNIGASIANTDIFIFQDADILFKNKAYHRIINHIQNKKFDAIRVGNECLNLSMPKTKSAHNKYMKNNWKEPPIMEAIRIKMKLGKKGSRDAPGACTAITRKAYIDIGGFSELFKVYGWEDCYFRYKVKKIKYTSLDMPMVHLAHEVNYQSGKQAENNELYAQLIYANKPEYEKILERDRIDLKKRYPKLAR